MRHAEASRGGAGGDHERALSPRGRQQALGAGAWLERFAAGSAEAAAAPLALCSSARRAVETLEELRQASPWLAAGERRPLRELYLAEADALLEALVALGQEPRAVLVVGHNPGLGSLARALSRGGDAAALARLGSGFPPAALAALALPRSWEEVARGGALAGLFAP